ncbi:MAG: mevalonate kinase [Caldilineaceae bacterium]|nr:mevalonate kinase [Caldilineaceae bacterium]
MYQTSFLPPLRDHPKLVTASAPGKVILVGEHAVVYGRPAIAVPVWERVARATIQPGAAGSGCWIVAHDLRRRIHLADAPPEDAMALVARATLAELGLPPNPDWQIELNSEIPIASGLGSGAALNAALVRAIHAQVGCTPDPAQVSDLVYLGEQLYHGTPSGIDNTVVAYGQPVWFIKGTAPRVFTPAKPFTLVIADSGVASPTHETVAGVRRRRERDPQRYDRWFDAIGELVEEARRVIEAGECEALGPIFDRNHALLQQIGVSTPQLDHLVTAARDAGARGAKLSGGGGGGNLIALVERASAQPVAAALEAAGAIRVMITTVGA